MRVVYMNIQYCIFYFYETLVIESLTGPDSTGTQDSNAVCVLESNYGTIFTVFQGWLRAIASFVAHHDWNTGP